MAEVQHKELGSVHLFAYVSETDPGAIGPQKGWVDTGLGVGNYLLKIRNDADDGWVVVSPNNQEVHRVTLAELTVITDVLADIDVLSMDLEGNRYYRVNGHLYAVGDDVGSGGGGVKVDFGGGSAVLGIMSGHVIKSDQDGHTDSWVTYGDFVFQSDFYMTLSFEIVMFVAAPGTFTLRFAQRVESPASPSILKQLSTLSVVDITPS